MEIQCLLGADIQMQLDECVALPASAEAMRIAVDRSLAWARRCQAAFAGQREAGRAGPGQALFGIVQGGTDPELRRRSAERWWRWSFPATRWAASRSARPRR